MGGRYENGVWGGEGWGEVNHKVGVGFAGWYFRFDASDCVLWGRGEDIIFGQISFPTGKQTMLIQKRKAAL